MQKPVHIILAVARNGAIGLNGKLPWRLPAEWKYFVETTRGGILIQGRHCQDNHGRPLPEREIIVLSRNPNYVPPAGVRLAHSLPEGLALAQASAHPGPIWIGGGLEIYREALPLADKIYLTEIDADFAGDTFLPRETFAQAGFTRVVSAKPGPPDTVPYVFKVLARA
ncbi:MAG TPA: dihydrofolate reductase [Opitutales bacterium]|nr:dihydrofolate reductase [Opitutales bacterium]